jgi:putative ABC transport system permease protein
VALAAVTAALVFGASLRHLVAEPAEYGWNWDRLVIAQSGYGVLDATTIEPLIDADRVEAWSMIAFNTVNVEGTDVPGIGLQRQTGDLGPTIIRGRAPTSQDEIVLGSITLDELGVDVGDQVTVGEGEAAEQLTVVGVAVLPTVGVLNTEHASLGRGVLMTYRGLAHATGSGSCADQNESLCPSAVALRFQPGVSTGEQDDAVERITGADPDGLEGGTFDTGLLQATEIRNERDIGGLPLALAATMAAGALVSLALALWASVRERRRELAVLKATGFTAAQCRSSVAWQATITATIGVVVGLPLGALAGSWLWASFAGELGVGPDASVQGLALLGVVVATVVLGNLAAAVPGRLAGRTQVGVALRTE